MMNFASPSQGCFENFCKDLDKTKEQFEEDVLILKKWFCKQPHLPQISFNKTGDIFFQKILIFGKLSIERSKQLVDMHFTLKSALPEFYSARDPLRAAMQRTFDQCSLVTLPGVTKEGYSVILFRIKDKDSTDFSVIEVCKLILMMADHRLFNLEELSLGLVIVSDYQNITMGHATKMTLPLLKKAEVCLTKGYAPRIKGIHFINPPPFMGTIVTIFKAILKNKVSSRMHVHASLESLHEHVDRDILLVDYGGREMKLSEMASLWRKELVSHRDWFVEHEVTGRVDESKRPGKSVDTNALFGIEGSFKKLAVD